MLFPAILMMAGAVATGAAAQISDVPPEVASYAEEASQWLIEGRDLPPDYRLRLLEMPPADRLQVIIFLRRSGLLVGQAWSLQDILRPAKTEGEASE